MQFKTLLLTLLPSAAGLPELSVKPATPKLQITTFQAYLRDVYSGYVNFATFMVGDTKNSFGAVCSIAQAEPLFSNTTWTECDIRNGSPDVKLSFQIAPGFNQLRIKKGWKGTDMYMWGFATQDTHWKEGKGGNVTAMWQGKYYWVNQPWDFEISSITG